MSVAELRSLHFVRQEGWQPSYLVTPAGRKVSRVNVIGILVGRPAEDLLLVDDSTGVIGARVVNPPSLAVGDVVLLLGRVGESGSERYLLVEAARKLDADWLRVRKLELQRRGEDIGEPMEPDEIPADSSPAPVETVENAPSTPAERLHTLIRFLDDGGGVDIAILEEKARAQGIDAPDKLLQRLLEQGEVFLPRAGLVKTLE